MQDYFSVLETCSLFSGISREDIEGLTVCLGMRTISVKKNAAIWSEGDPAVYIGIVLSGCVQIVKEDFFGNRSILDQVEPGSLFGESFAAVGATLPVSAIAAQDSQIALIDCKRITVSCGNACGFHSQMIHNLLRVVAEKNLQVNQKLEIIAQRSTREKLLAYLNSQAKRAGSNSFTIPFDRQALADYLGVERSAMSAEISKLRKDGTIVCDRSRFTLL